VIEAAFHDEGHGYDLFGLHPPTLERATKIAGAAYDRYFRITSHGIEHIPASGPTILVANHGGVLPIDAGLLCIDVLRRLTPTRIPRPIADHFVPNLPFVSTLFARCGMVDGTRENVAHLLARGELVAIWPEGTTGPAKRFRDRYQLQDWRIGFAELAIRFHATVVPVAILGIEESWPLATKLATHWFGAPYLPIPAWPIPLPTHIHFEYLPPYQFRDDPRTAANQVREVVQRQLHDLRNARRWFR